MVADRRELDALLTHEEELRLGVTIDVRHGGRQERYLLDEAEYGAHGGAFPVIVRGTGPVGTVTVSGLPQAEDHRFVVEALRRFLAAG
jgi:uncharacterized protein (UPF0303 family)